MSSKRSRIGAGKIVGLLALGLAIGVVGISTWRADANLNQSTPPPLPVSALLVEYDGSAVIDESFPGLVSARRESALGFQQSGRIDLIAVDVGDRVVEGQVIARLDTRGLMAQIAAADAQTAEAAAQTDLARDTQARQEILLDQGHISQQRLDEAVTATAAALARQNAAGASAEALRVQLDLAEIEAPFDGVITGRAADEGTIASPGQPIIQLVEDQALEIRLGLPIAVARRLERGQAYGFVSDSARFNAVLRAETGVVDRQTRTVTAIFDLPPESRAVAGEIARLQVATPIDETGFWVPTAALSEGRRGLWTVFLLRPAGDEYLLEARVVETLRVEAERAFVRGAIADGDYVLASGVQRVVPGQRVVRIEDGARN